MSNNQQKILVRASNGPHLLTVYDGTSLAAARRAIDLMRTLAITLQGSGELIMFVESPGRTLERWEINGGFARCEEAYSEKRALAILSGNPVLGESQKRTCPTCGSPDPGKHPATAFEGEVSICPDPFHPPVLDALFRRNTEPVTETPIVTQVSGGFEITHESCPVCGEPPFGGEYCCGCVRNRDDYTGPWIAFDSCMRGDLRAAGVELGRQLASHNPNTLESSEEYEWKNFGNDAVFKKVEPLWGSVVWGPGKDEINQEKKAREEIVDPFKDLS